MITKEIILNIKDEEIETLEEQYDELLRALCFSLSVGGYNSEGLIDPKIAKEKIEWGINNEIRMHLIATQKMYFPDLTPVITWLENGCNPLDAAKELRLYRDKNLQAVDYANSLKI